MNSDSNIREVKFERAISYVLITGVLISLLLEIIGIFFFFESYGNLNIAERTEIFIHGRNFFNFMAGLFQEGFAAGKAILLMTLGITVLMLTPYARVVLSVFYFARMKNIKYTLITLFVLALLTASLASR